LQRFEVHVADRAPLPPVKNQHDRAVFQCVCECVRFVVEVCGGEERGFAARFQSLGFFYRSDGVDHF